MAKAPTNKDTGTKVTRISAKDSAKKTASKTKVKPAVSAAKTKKPTTGEEQPTKNPLKRFGRYFKGAWHELRQVRWPDRKSTWAMTGALLAFTAFFIVVILVLDFAFSELFKLILGSN